ncbi:MAG: baseplate J/gp47 family protein [Pseudomonadota bacterium]
MAFLPRSLDDISRQVRGLFRQYITGTDASLKQNVTYVLAKVLVLMGRDYELRLEYLARQRFLRTADDIHVEALCADIRIYRRKASPAKGLLDVTGLANQTYPAGLEFIVGNLIFAVQEPFTMDAQGQGQAKVQALMAGSASNLEEGAQLALVDPQTAPTLGQTATVAIGGFGGGADIETIRALRRRGLARQGQPPNGGNLNDYVNWALEVPGVTHAWAYRFANGANTIGVLFLFAGRVNGIPEQGDVDAVNAYILKRQMVRMDPVAAAPVARSINLTIADLVGDTPETRAAIEAAVAALYMKRVRPGTTAEPFTLSRSWLVEAIAGAAGETSHRLTEPAGDIVLTGGEFPVMGTVTYV